MAKVIHCRHFAAHQQLPRLRLQIRIPSNSPKAISHGQQEYVVGTAIVKLIETDDIFCIVERLKQRLDCYNSGTLNTLRRSASLGFFSHLLGVCKRRHHNIKSKSLAAIFRSCAR